MNQNLNPLQDIQKIKKSLLNFQFNRNEKILVISADDNLSREEIQHMYPHSHVVSKNLKFANINTHKNLDTNIENIWQEKVKDEWIFNPLYMPFHSAQFDIVILVGIFSRYQAANCEQQLLIEINRVLIPNGRILLLSERYIHPYFMPLINICKFCFKNHDFENYINSKKMQKRVSEMLYKMQIKIHYDQDKLQQFQNNLLIQSWQNIQKTITLIKTNQIHIILSKPIYNHERYLIESR